MQLPALRWARRYDRTTFGDDLRAGATVAVLLVPQGMAYAALAGMPPIAGLYAAMVSLVVYALLGTSNHVSVGPVAIDSLLVAGAVAPLADGDPGRYVALAGLLALLVGVMQAGAGVLRLGALVSFLSVPVISGFTSAAALTIAASQLKDLLGVTVTGGSSSFLESVQAVTPHLSEADLLTLALGVAGIAALVGLRRLSPKLPGPLLLVAAFVGLVSILGWQDRVAVLGEVPTGLPVPHLPALGGAEIAALLPAAAAIALVSYMETVSTGSAFARRTRTRIDPDQELVAVGTANTAAGFFGGFPVAGGFSRGAVNFGAGARTPMSGVLAAIGLVIAVLTITPLLSNLPKVALAAVILVAVGSLIDVRAARAIGRVRRSDLVALVLTAAATLALGPALGLGVGVAVSIVLFLRQTARPHLPELGQVAGTRTYRNVKRHPVAAREHVAVLRVDAPLYFANSRTVADALTDVVHARPSVRALVLDCSALTGLDYTGAETLADLEHQLDEADVALHLAAVRGPVQDVLERTLLWPELVEAGRVHLTVADAVDATEGVDRVPVSR